MTTSHDLISDLIILGEQQKLTVCQEAELPVPDHAIDVWTLTRGEVVSGGALHL